MIEIEGIAGKLAFLAPFAVLALVVWRATRQRVASWPGEHRMLKQVSGAPLGVMSPGTLEAEASASESDTPPAVPETPLHPTGDPAQHPSPQADWPAVIAAAAQQGDNVAVARAYLGYARSELADGRSAEAGDQLRACLQFAARSRDRALQAEARLELAELSRADGDLTTACEHWQIARALFHELSSKQELDKTEKLMRTHGCPTDWVLNDF
jgi:hypothetical protein